MRHELTVWLARDTVAGGSPGWDKSLFLREPVWNADGWWEVKSDDDCDSYVQIPPDAIPDAFYPAAGEKRQAKLVVEVNHGQD